MQLNKLKYYNEFLKKRFASGVEPEYYLSDNDKTTYENLIKACERNNDTDAFHFLGDYYQRVWGNSPIDNRKALYFYLLSFRKTGIIESGISAAHVYHNIEEYKKSFRIYKILADANVPIGLSAVGVHYHHGDMGVPKDLDKALHYYRLAYQYGNLQTPVQIYKLYKEKRQYLKATIALMKFIIIVIPKRFRAMLNRTMMDKVKLM